MRFRFRNGYKDKQLRLPLSKMYQHFLWLGTTGVGKTQINKQLLYEAEERKWAAVVLDSKNGEYIQEFYRPERGDKILNPKDARCPYWRYYDEFTDEADCLSVTRGMVPQHPNNPQAQFWDDYGTRLLAYLSIVEPKMDCEKLARIIISEVEIARRVRRTEYGQLFSPAGSSPMRTSVIQTMSQIGYALRMMPRRQDTDHSFCIRDWARERKGWLFLSNTAETREAVVPIQSAWAFMAMQKVMSAPDQHTTVLIDLDEADRLNLPGLVEAMTMFRSTKNILALGFQNLAQFEEKFAKQANTVWAQAGTRCIFAMGDDTSAKRMQDLIGEVETRVIRQTTSSSLFGRRERDSYSGPEDIRKPAVLASEIDGQPDRHFLFLQRPTDDEIGLHVLRLKLPILPARSFHPGVVERTVPVFEPDYQEVDVQPEATPTENQQPAGISRLL